MNRRNFIVKSSILGGLLLSDLSCAPQPATEAADPKYKLGYQLFSIRDEMATKPIETLKILKQAGYEDFEIYGYDPIENSIYGHTPTDLKKKLEDLELTVSSGHYGFSDYLLQPEEALLRFVDQCIVAAKKLDSQYITWPWLDPTLRNIDNFKLMAPKLNLIGEKVKAAGLGFAYHNHGFEFEDHNGENGYDIILKETDPSLVKLQMDMYWVMHAGTTTPIELIEAHPGRFVMWHIKDMDTQTRDYTELGNGSINYRNVLPDPDRSGLEYYYIEQGGNYAVNSKESAIQSAEFLQQELQHLL